MQLDYLQIALQVARSGSFAATARSQGVDPSLISRAVATLEEQLGFRLFQRTTRALALTEAGSAYLERVAPLIEELELAGEQAQHLTRAPQGLLRVTASVSFGQVCVLPHLASFRERYPQVTLELLFSDAVMDLIAERIDVAIRLSPRIDSGFVGQELMRTRYRVVASPAWLSRHGRPRHPADLAQHGCAVFPMAGFRTRWRFRSRAAGADGAEFDVPVQAALAISSALALRQSALDGLAPSLLANWLVDDALADGRLVDLFPEFDATATDFQTAAWILYPSRAYLPSKVRAFVSHLRDSLAQARAASVPAVLQHASTEAERSPP